MMPERAADSFPTAIATKSTQSANARRQLKVKSSGSVRGLARPLEVLLKPLEPKWSKYYGAECRRLGRSAIENGNTGDARWQWAINGTGMTWRDTFSARGQSLLSGWMAKVACFAAGLVLRPVLGVTSLVVLHAGVLGEKGRQVQMVRRLIHQAVEAQRAVVHKGWVST